MKFFNFKIRNADRIESERKQIETQIGIVQSSAQEKYETETQKQPELTIPQKGETKDKTRDTIKSLKDCYKWVGERLEKGMTPPDFDPFIKGVITSHVYKFVKDFGVTRNVYDEESGTEWNGWDYEEDDFRVFLMESEPSDLFKKVNGCISIDSFTFGKPEHKYTVLKWYYKELDWVGNYLYIDPDSIMADNIELYSAVAKGEWIKDFLHLYISKLSDDDQVLNTL